MKHLQSFENFLHESKAEALFRKGDEVTIKDLYGSGKKYSGKDGVITSEPMEYTNGKYAYMVKVGRSEVEFNEYELNNK
jgi:hypothetical protein